jgi:hypothetical protein
MYVMKGISNILEGISDISHVCFLSFGRLTAMTEPTDAYNVRLRDHMNDVMSPDGAHVRGAGGGGASAERGGGLHIGTCPRKAARLRRTPCARPPARARAWPEARAVLREIVAVEHRTDVRLTVVPPTNDAPRARPGWAPGQRPDGGERPAHLARNETRRSLGSTASVSALLRAAPVPF